MVIILFSFLIVRSGKGEVAAIRNNGVSDDNAWKAYRDAMEGEKNSDTQPLF